MSFVGAAWRRFLRMETWHDRLLFAGLLLSFVQIGAFLARATG